MSGWAGRAILAAVPLTKDEQMKKVKYWAVVMDAGHARLMQKHGRLEAWSPVEDETVARLSPAGAAQGRSFESVGGARHAVHPHTDPRALEKRRFTDMMADRLTEAARANLYDRLLLVAPPQVLGELRQALAEPALSRVTGELDKDLIKIPMPDLGHRLDELAVIL
jgi:protein required for attachment to host cells